ncbi:MAG: hypothetical protein ACI8Y7_000855 [Candidatus Woesearchaeota archaeon]|jgi:hypothetical protein
MNKFLIIGLIVSIFILASCSQTDLSDSDKVLLESKNSEDPEICNEVDKINSAQCLMNVYTNIAVQTNDSTACNNLDLCFRFSCVINVTIVLKNQEVCDPIGQDSLQYKCKELIVKQIAIDNNNVSICNEF